MKKFGLYSPSGNRNAVIKKGLIIMKITLLLILISTFNLLATNTYSQTARVSLNLNQTSLKQALKEIEKSSEFYFLYNNELVDVERKVDINADNEQINTILDHLFANQDIKYTVYDRQIVISPANMPLPQEVQRKVSGKVTDQSGITFPGVTVVVKGTTSGVITDAKGNYSLSNIPSNTTLSFSFVGMKSQEITIGNKTTINVVLQGETIDIEEVVAIGYGTKLKGELTGSIAKTDSKIFETRPLTNTLSALQGALPGVSIIRGSGQPGSSNYTLQIRGISSYSGSKALVLIDGVAGNLDLINPSDISDVTILKDAAASIYGARAADGVVLITTRKGTKGRPTVSYSGNYGIKTPEFLKEYASTIHMAEMYDQAMTNIGQPGVSKVIYDKIRANAEPDITGGWVKFLEGFPGFFGNQDHNKEVYGNGIQQNHNISISGGGDNNNYLFSAGYNSDGGVLNYGKNESNRYNLRMNYDFRLFDRLNIETRTSFDNKRIDEPGNLAEALRVLPRYWNFLPVYNPSGQFYEYIGYGNPVQELLTGKSTSNNANFTTNIKADLKILNDLKLVAQVGFVNGYYFANDNHPRYYRYPWSGVGPLTPGRYSTSYATYNNSKSFYGNYTTYLVSIR